MKSYYITWSSWNIYCDCKKFDAEILSHLVLEAGGENPIFLPQNKGENMPDFLVFNAAPDNLVNIQNALEIALGTEWIIISEVDWVL